MIASPDADPRPLVGVKILDITANMSGPFATMVLGDQGADVIKIEPPEGDPLRQVGSGVDGLLAYYANVNRSKRSVALDLRDRSNGPRLARLADWADVVVHNYRSKPAVELGIDAAAMCDGRSGLIHVTITGWGSRGPLADRPAYDHVVQAMSGMCARQATGADGVPDMVRHGIVDKLTGWATAQAISSALVKRARHGVGVAIEVSMLDVAVGTLWPDGMMNHTALDPSQRRPDISAGFRLHPTLDGYVSFMVMTPRQVDGLAAALGIDLHRLPTESRTVRDAVAIEARRRARTMTTDEMLAALERHDVPVAPVVDLDGIFALEQVVANETVQEVDHPQLGRLRQARPVVRFGADGVEALRPAEPLGHSTGEVLEWLDADLGATGGGGF